LKAGKHVLCEKPVAPTPYGIDEIEAAQKASGCVFSGVFQLRFGRGAQQVRALLDQGRFGRLHLGIAETLWSRDDAYYGVPWRGAWATECGGVTVSQAIHAIDAMVWFLGEPASVFAQAGTFRAPIESDDTAVAIIRFANGGIGQITSTVTAFGEERTRLEVHGTQLSAVSTGPVYDCTIEPFKLGTPNAADAPALAAEIEERFPRGFKMLHRGAVNDFLEAIEQKREPLAGIEACRTAVQVTAAIYKSAMTNEVVKLPLAADDPFYSHLPPDGLALPAVDSGERRD
jgi:predicted dehydrogenase